MVERFKEADIKTLSDLEDYIYWECGVLDMEDVRRLLDIICKHKELLKEHL